MKRPPTLVNYAKGLVAQGFGGQCPQVLKPVGPSSPQPESAGTNS